MGQGHVTPGSRRTRRSTTNSKRLTTLVFWLLLTFGFAPTMAAAQTPGVNESPALVDPSSVSLEVVGQSTFVAADGSFGIDIAVSPADQLWLSAENYELSVTLFGLLESEAEVDEPLAQPLNRLPSIPLGNLVPSEHGVIHIDVPVRSGAEFDDQQRVLLPRPGVYPISIELRTETGPITSTRTHMVRLPQVTNEDSGAGDGNSADGAGDDGLASEPSGPVPVAVVLNVSTAEGLTLPDVLELLTNHPTIPLTVVLQEGVTNVLRANPELAGGFVAAMAGRPVMAVPTIDLDPSALAEIDQQALFFESHRSTNLELKRLGLTVADGLTVLDAPLTQDGASVMADLDLQGILDTESQASGVGRLETGRSRLQIFRIDRELSRILGGGDNGPHRANRILAKLTLRSEVDDAPVVLGGDGLGVDPRRSIDAFLRALSQPGAPQPILLSDAGGGPSIRRAERPEQDLLPVADLLLEAQELLVTFDGFHNGGGNTPDFYRQQILAGLTRQRNPTDRQRALTTLMAQMRNDMAVVELHEGQPVTLAAREAPIPILLDSDAVGPRNVMLRFDSDKVVADHDRQIITIQPGTSSINVELQARSLGISPLEVSVWTPDGETQLAATRFEIRSTAIPGFGLLVSIGAVCLLGAWWVVDAKKRRASERNQSPRSASV